jgi:hypothetical protein
VVGEHSGMRRSGVVKHRGVSRKENVGMSNDNGVDNTPRRKTKGSCIYVHQIRVSRSLRISREVTPMGNG